MSFQTLLFALLGGIIPALLWLWFWLKEDKKRPEPRGLLMLAFITGMIAVPLVIPFEQFFNINFEGTILIILWASVEEIFKFGGAYITVLRRKEMSEPIDAVVYMITVALGFAALENTFFLINPIIEGDFVNTVISGNLRFLGATLLHTLSSAMIGVMIAFSFYGSATLKKTYVFIGVVLAITLHSMFNFFIMKEGGEKLLTIFFFVWVGIIILILLFERIKNIKKR